MAVTCSTTQITYLPGVCISGSDLQYARSYGQRLVDGGRVDDGTEHGRVGIQLVNFHDHFHRSSPASINRRGRFTRTMSWPSVSGSLPDFDEHSSLIQNQIEHYTHFPFMQDYSDG